MILPFPIFVNPDRTNPPAEWKDGTMRAAAGARTRKIPLDICRRDWYHGDNCIEKAMTKTDLSF